MLKATFLLLLLSSFFYSQTYEQLMDYSRFYNKNIDEFREYVKELPTVDTSSGGIRQMVFEMDGFNIGVEEHPSNNDMISEIFIFQTQAENPHSDWLKIHQRINSDTSFKFIKGMFDDKEVRSNDLQLDHLLNLVKKKIIRDGVRYAVRYQKESAYYTLSVIGNKMVFSIDGKNY